MVILYAIIVKDDLHHFEIHIAEEEEYENMIFSSKNIIRCTHLFHKVGSDFLLKSIQNTI